MEIKFNTTRPTEAEVNQPPVRANAPQPVSDDAVFGKAAALEQALKEVPEIRAEKVERARALVSDNHYPPQVTMDRIASLLALNIRSQS